MRFRLPPTVLLAAALSGCALLPPVAAFPEETVLEADVVVAPLRRDGRRFVLDLRLDGAGPYPMLLDTGSSVLVLGPEAAEEAGAGGFPLPMRIRGPAGTEWAWVPRFSLDEVRLDGVGQGPGASFLGMDGVVLDIPGEAGIAGLGLFSGCLVTFDFPAQRVEIRRGALPEPDGLTVLSYETPDDVPVVSLRVGSRTVEATIDTGFNGILSLDRETAEDMEFEGEAVPTTFDHVHGSGTGTMRRLRDSIRLGSFTGRRIPVLVSDGPPLLGVVFLRNFRVTFDPAGCRVRFDALDPAGARALRGE